MTAPIIVFDTATQLFLGNRVFDPEYAARFPGASWLPRLNERCLERGWQMMTADVFLAAQVTSSPVCCISDMVTPYTRSVLERGAMQTVILSGESPNRAWIFYHHLTRYTAPYRHAFLFCGVQNKVNSSTQFHSLYWPNAHRDVLPGHPWRERKFLGIVSSNKHRFNVSSHRPLRKARQFARQMVWYYLQIVNPLFRFKDLYQERLEAIRYFANTPGFRLFGFGWEQPNGLSEKYYQAAKRAGAVPVDDKLATISGFKFALCFENCAFPGYVTEKIFDCFFAGCIPVYWGAPDIVDFVPVETFVDVRQFDNWMALDHYLRNMPESKAQNYRDAARDFLASDAFDKFHQDYFVNELMEILEIEFASLTCPPKTSPEVMLGLVHT